MSTVDIETNVHADHQEQVQQVQQHVPLRDAVRNAIKQYLEKLGSQEPSDMYDMVLAEVEAPLFHMVMEYTKGNQSKAAIIMGISRGTLRKKLKIYDLL